MRTIKLAVAMFVATTLVVAAQAKEEKITIDKVPKAVMDAVKAKFPNAQVTGAEKEDEDGQPVYEVALKDQGQKVEVIATPEGKILAIEKVILAKNLPNVVTEALEIRHPKATIRLVEAIYKNDKLDSYELLIVTADKTKRWEVVFDPKGKFVKEEAKPLKKKKEKDDKK